MHTLSNLGVKDSSSAQCNIASGNTNTILKDEHNPNVISKLNAHGRTTLARAACQAVAVQVMREANLAPLELPYALLSTQTLQMQWHVSDKETVNHFFSTLSYKLR